MKGRKVTFMGGPLHGVQTQVPQDFPKRPSLPMARTVEDEDGNEEIIEIPGAHLYMQSEDDMKVYVHIGCTS